MNFYVLSDGGRGRFTWGMRLRPRLSEVGGPCDVCGNGKLYPGRYPERPLGIEVEGGREYPDLLGCGSYPLLIVSEAVISDWERHRVTGYEKFPMTVVSATKGDIRRATPPQYYHLKMTGECDVDLHAMGAKLVYRCPKCNFRKFERLEPGPLGIFPMVIVADSWDGSDLFQSDLFRGVHFCSQRIFDLAGRYRRTNFRFRRPELSHRFMEGEVDYLDASPTDSPEQ